MPDDKRQIDPKPLSPEYHKAHKQLMLWAAILFIWELVGIDLEKAKEAGGNAAAIINAIKSPQAIPWALVILVAYFLFKTTIEWYHCNLDRRGLRVAKVDFAAAWLVPMTACALYAFQAFKKVQLADVIQQEKTTWSIAGFLSGVFLTIVVTMTVFEGSSRKVKLSRSWHESGPYFTRIAFFSLSMTIIVNASLWTLIQSFQSRIFARGLLVGAASAIVARIFIKKIAPLFTNAVARRFRSKAITHKSE